MKNIKALLLFACIAIGMVSCEDYDDFSSKHEYGDQNVYGTKSVYIPESLKDNDFELSTSQWSYERSRQSENWIVFWEEGYGEDPTYIEKINSVDINALLQKLESAYTLFKDTYKILPSGSNTDNTKMMLFLIWNDDDVIFEAVDFDNKIGAVRLSIKAAQEGGQALAKAVAEAFLHQVYADDTNRKAGFKYSFGESVGDLNVFWDQTSNWLSYKSLETKDQFASSYFEDFVAMSYKNIMNENMRMANYFIHDYWTEKNDETFVGQLWQGAVEPEDYIEAYQRLTGMNQTQFNDDFFEYASKTVFWDIEGLQETGKSKTTRAQTVMEDIGDGFWQVDPSNCPENYGYNVINLNIVDSATVVTANFVGLAGEDGYNTVNVDKAGWRYGFVARLKDGTIAYSDVAADEEGALSFKLPDYCDKLVFVVSGAPTEHWSHVWDNDETNNEQLPYKVMFQGTNLFGFLSINKDLDPVDVEISVDLAHAVNDDYVSTNVEINTVTLFESFQLYPNEFKKLFTGGDIKLLGVNNDGSLYEDGYTANVGYWYVDGGNVGNWGETATFFCEFDSETNTFNIGQYPGRLKAGESYTLKQQFVYTNERGVTGRATLTFNVTLE